MMIDKFEVSSSQVESIRNWFRNRGGVLRWKNLELGVNRPDMLTPATDPEGRDGLAYCKPHWSMGQATLIAPDDIDVVDRAYIETLPQSWFKPCDKCGRSGRRSVAELASLRRETVEECAAKITSGDIYIAGGDFDGTTFQCNYCHGTGCAHYGKLYVAIRRRYWGATISDTGKLRAEKYARKLGDGVLWDYEYIGYGRAELKFYRETRKPFTLD